MVGSRHGVKACRLNSITLFSMQLIGVIVTHYKTRMQNEQGLGLGLTLQTRVMLENTLDIQ